MFDSIKNWEFLQEPWWRWFIFVGLLLLIFFMWRIIIGHMKAAE